MSAGTARTKIHPLTILAAILFAGAIIGLVYVLIQLTAPKVDSNDPRPTALLTLIPAPTHTPTISTAQSPSPTPDGAAPVLPPGVIGVGAYVKVGGTQGAGLRMRTEPGTESEIRFMAMDEEVFLVVGGPLEKDGYVWWQMTAPYDQNRSGWSAQAFLELVEQATPTP